jgi:hypothetical protein
VSHWRRWAIALTALTPWAAALYVAPAYAQIWLALGACLSVVALFVVASISSAEQDQSAVPTLHERAPVVELTAAPAISDLQKVAVVSRLQQAIVRLNQSRKDTELSAIKLGECAKRMDLLRRAQLDFFTTQIAPRLSKSATIPETLKSLDSQQQAEVQRMVVLLQFHDAWEQSLTKIEAEELQMALGLLEPDIAQPVQTEKGPSGATMTTVTPVRRQQVELF